MFRIGSELLEQSKASLEQGKSDKKAWSARDLLSILIRANAMPDISESQRLSDEDVLAREYASWKLQIIYQESCFAEIPTFLVAGHETTR